MNDFIQSFSNRETALLIWLFIIMFVFIFKKEIRNYLFEILKQILTTPALLISIILILDYSLFMIDTLQKIGFWDVSLIKDSIFWFLGTALVIVYNIIGKSKKNGFREIILEIVKLTIIFEFILNFYTFSLIKEIILLPILLIVGINQAFAERSPIHKPVERLFKTINSILGLMILCYVGYKLITQPTALFTVSNMKSFFLPIILTIVFIPFVYLLKLYSEYESLFLRLPCLIDDPFYRKSVKRKILLVANFDLYKLTKISSRLAKLVLVDESRSLEDIKKISK